MSLLPSRPDTSESADADPRVIGVDSEDADDVLAALSSDTARNLLQEIHGEPATPSELADRVETSVQNVQYHLGNLEDAGAIEVVDTAYSEKGREMNVYAAADKPLVIYAGDQEEESTLRTALSRLLGPVSLLGIASLAIQSTFGGSLLPFGDGDGGSDPGAASDPTPAGGAASGDGADAASTPEEGGDVGLEAVTETPEPSGTPTPDVIDTPTPEAVETASEAAASLPPGLLFFAGGLFVLGIVGVVQYYR
ncbi:ArsR/SmtB family transcription factor [Halovenus marina]|uniref:ArsR/SmtB family transcription factor n=1 Tax=Halovenus marina TaxID=3396621 RepID=UPI003F54B36D